jgi:hypothetical protein
MQGIPAWNDSVDDFLADCHQRVVITHNKFDAAGDFILMARNRWHELHGFQELRSSGTIDTYLVALAEGRGMKQIHLPHAIYHQEHGRPSGRPQLGWQECYVGRANGDGWGLGEVELQTEVIR